MRSVAEQSSLSQHRNPEWTQMTIKVALVHVQKSLRSLIMFHELMHIDIVTDIPQAPPAIKDVSITVDGIRDGQTIPSTQTAYYPQRCKLLARFQPKSANGDHDTGFFTQRNGTLRICGPFLAR